jgi:hypothetical protein
MKATLMPQPVNNLASAMSRKNTESLAASNQSAMHFDEQLDLVELGSNNYQNNNYESEHTYYEEPEYAPLEASSPKLLTKPSAVAVPEVAIPVPSPVAVTPTESFDSPVDLSDPIAQIDVEMERLAWDRNMGRGYLQKAFNKRSRQQLSDNELIQFLTHLKSLPTPTHL